MSINPAAGELPSSTLHSCFNSQKNMLYKHTVAVKMGLCNPVKAELAVVVHEISKFSSFKEDYVQNCLSLIEHWFYNTNHRINITIWCLIFFVSFYKDRWGPVTTRHWFWCFLRWKICKYEQVPIEKFLIVSHFSSTSHKFDVVVTDIHSQQWKWKSYNISMNSCKYFFQMFALLKYFQHHRISA